MQNMSRNLTEQQKLFIEYFSQTGNATQSCIKAGYSKNTAEQQGYELKHKLAREIETATKKILSGSVPIAVDVLTKLVSDPKIPPSTRLQAVNSLLDRTGYQTTTKIEDVTHKKSDEELRTELEHLMSTLHIVKAPTDDNGSNGGNSIN